VRPNRVVATAALIAVLASVAVPRIAGSHNPSAASPIDESAFVDLDVDRGTSMAPFTLDPADVSASRLDFAGRLAERLPSGTPTPRDGGAVPVAVPIVRPVATATAWRYDREISWYGPGLYGNGTACGQILTDTLIGVANRTLPCGTRVTFTWQGRTVTARVVDRGPYVSGRQFDLTHGACVLLNHCFTGPIYWRLGS
jgi:rare lipoprotein A (peptidoglycan hydrolase)